MERNSAEEGKCYPLFSKYDLITDERCGVNNLVLFDGVNCRELPLVYIPYFSGFLG